MSNLNKFLTCFDRPLAFIAKICTFISGMCLVTLVASFSWLVFGRYLLNDTPTWVEQLALLLIVVITFLSSAVGIKERTHLSVEIVPYALPHKTRSILYIFIYVVVAVFGFIMMIKSYDLTLFSWTTNIPLLDVPEGLRTVPMMISGGLLCLFSFGNILKEITAHTSDVLVDIVEDPHQTDKGTISQETF
jgi:TRAP-type transport system small permease protein